MRTGFVLIAALLVVIALLWFAVSGSYLRWHPLGDAHAATTQTSLQLSARGLQQHRHQGNAYSEADWDKVLNIQHDFTPHKVGKRSPLYKTFGWYPNWMGTAHKALNYKLLWGISYFGYQVNPATGGAKSTYSWQTTTLVDSAQANDCKVFLSLINLGAAANQQLLNNHAAREKLIENSIAALTRKDGKVANGLVVDFEEVRQEDRDSLTTFLLDLGKALHAEKKELVVTLYAVDANEVFQFEQLNTIADYYVMMGYEYSYAGSANASANTPLRSAGNSLEASVTSYLDRKVPKEQFIVALPYYGNEWTVSDSSKGAGTIDFVLSPSYSQLGHYDTASHHLDHLSYSQYLSTESDDKWRQLWYDDAKTLDKKQQWIKNQGLAGVGIWALGYDQGSTELWKVLRKNFGEPKPGQEELRAN